HSSPSFGSRHARSRSTPPTSGIESAGDAPTAGAAGSHLRRTTPAFAFTTPCGFRTAPRLAHMLDSLVRVSRRVGSRALRTVPGRPTPRSARAPGHPKAPDARSLLAGRRVVRSRAYSTRPKESYLARGLLTAVQPVAALARR
ncbi:unnamed protein product, partial [Clavelina lepadiformis]